MDIVGLLIFGGLALLSIAAGISALYDYYKNKKDLPK